MDANTLPAATRDADDRLTVAMSGCSAAMNTRQAKQQQVAAVQRQVEGIQQQLVGAQHQLAGVQQELELAMQAEAAAKAEVKAALFASAPGAGAAAEQQPGAPPSPPHEEAPQSGQQGVREEEMPLAMPIGVAANVGVAATGGGGAGGAALPAQAQAADAQPAAPAPAGAAAVIVVDVGVDAAFAPTAPGGDAAAAAASQGVAESPGEGQMAAAVPVAAAPAPPPAPAPALNNINGAAAAAPGVAAQNGAHPRVEPTPIDAPFLGLLADMGPKRLNAAVGGIDNFPAGIYNNAQTKEEAFQVDLQAFVNGKPEHAQLPPGSYKLKTLRAAMDRRNGVLLDPAVYQKFWTVNKWKKEARFQANARAYVQQNGGAAAPVAAQAETAAGPGPTATAFAGQMQAVAPMAAVMPRGGCLPPPPLLPPLLPLTDASPSASVVSAFLRMAGGAPAPEMGDKLGARADTMPPPLPPLSVPPPPVQHAGGQLASRRRGRVEHKNSDRSRAVKPRQEMDQKHVDWMFDFMTMDDGAVDFRDVEDGEEEDSEEDDDPKDGDFHPRRDK